MRKVDFKIMGRGFLRMEIGILGNFKVMPSEERDCWYTHHSQRGNGSMGTSRRTN